MDPGPCSLRRGRDRSRQADWHLGLCEMAVPQLGGFCPPGNIWGSPGTGVVIRAMVGAWDGPCPAGGDAAPPRPGADKAANISSAKVRDCFTSS